MILSMFCSADEASTETSCHPFSLLVVFRGSKVRCNHLLEKVIEGRAEVHFNHLLEKVIENRAELLLPLLGPFES